MTDYSDGPWKWHPKSRDGSHNGSVYCEKYPGHAYAIAMQPKYVSNVQWAVDACLIASAPDLLAALHQIDALATRHEAGAIGKAQKIARAAISKATGEA